MPDVDSLLGKENTFTLDSKTFIEAAGQVVFCASTDQGRPALTAVHVLGKGNVLIMESADGFRLARKRIALEQPLPSPVDALVPAAALGEAVKIAALCDRVTVVCVPDRGQVIFHGETADLVTQTIEGQYPDLDQVIPKRSTTRVTVSRAALLNAVRQAEIFAREGVGRCKLEIAAGDDTHGPHLTVSGQSEETGQQEAEMEAVLEGPGLLIAFNVAFLKEVLSAMPVPEAVIETTTDAAPAVFRPAGKDDVSWVIMPMVLSN